MEVPRLSMLPRGSFTIENEAETDSQIWCSSSLCLDVHDQQLDTKRRDHEDNINVSRQRDEKRVTGLERERGNETMIIVKVIFRIIVFLTKES